MKTKLQVKNLTGIMIMLLVIIPMLNVSGQAGNILTGSSMETADASAWDVVVRFSDELNDTPEYEFGSDKGCTNCVGNGLNVWAAGSGYSNIIFYQEITLEANKVYKANAAYKSNEVLAQNLWTQLKIGLDTFPHHENNGVKLMGTNAWSGCGLIEDGMLADFACDGDHITAGFIAPDSLGATYTAHFAIVVGMWTNADNQYPYDVTIDEVVLIDSIASLVSVEMENGLGTPKAKLMNFPNPFKEKTTIIYDLPSRSNVNLTVYNMMGQEVSKLYQGEREAGTHRAELNLKGIQSNMLICKLEYNDQVVVQKMMITK